MRMATFCSISGRACVRMLVLGAALLAAGVGADSVTWARCKDLVYWKYQRLRTFPTDINATSLDLSDCNLTEIQRSDFDGLPNVEVMWLNINEITQIHPAAFTPVTKLEHLYLTSNKLRNLPAFADSLPYLDLLDLGDNLLEGIYDPKTFSACVKLSELSMSQNKIDYLHPDVFKPLPELFDLNLNSNKLISLPEGLFASNTKLKWVKIRDNNIAYFPANFASELRYAVSFGSITFYNNPWQCVCLLELVADMKRFRLKYSTQELADRGINNRYDGSQPECVFSGVTTCTRTTDTATGQPVTSV